MWRSILSTAVLSAFVVLPQGTWGGIITVPVPDLLGTYDCSGFSSIGMRQTEVDLSCYDFASARLIVRGIIQQGLVRGDGITRAPQEALLMGSWGPSFQFGGGIGQIIGPLEPGSGPFALQIGFPDPVYTFPSLDKPPQVFRLILAPVISLNLVPWLVEQPEPIDVFGRWGEGLEIVTPLTATITEAYWELEGPTLPEPATLSLLALGALAILRRRKR